MKNSLILGIFGLIIVLGAIILASTSGLFTLSESNNNAIRLGATLALSGDGVPYGATELKGVKLAIKDFELENNVKVDLVVEDMMTDAKSAVLSTQKLITVDKVDGIIGTTWLDTFQGAAELSNNNEIVMISPSGFINAIKLDKNYDYVFSTFFRNDVEMKQVVEYFKEKNYKKIVVFYEDNPFWQMLAKEIVNYGKQKGFEVIDYGFVPNTIDFRTIISEAKQLNPDAVFFGFDKQQSILSFAKQIKEIYPDAKVFSNETPGSLVYQSDYTKLFESFSYIFPVDADIKFIENYKKEYNEEPGVSASNSYDATTILLESILKSKQTGQSVLQILKKSEFDTTTFGKIKFDSIGGVQGGEFVIKQVVGGELKEMN